MSTKALDFINRWSLFGQFSLWPGMCVVCQQPSKERRDLCSACADALIRVADPCLGCGLPLPPGHPADRRCGACVVNARPVHRTMAPFAWQPPLAPLVSAYKYQGHLQHGRVLGTLLLEEIRTAYAPTELPQLLLPVPLHPRRLRERGYNQALLLARQLGRVLDIPVGASLLQRIRDTPAQQGLNAAQRKRNLQGAFEITDREAFAGLTRITVVDDVITTMSTVDTLARLLHRRLPQALDVHAWAIARA
jgi:ComF family protein